MMGNVLKYDFAILSVQYRTGIFINRYTFFPCLIDILNKSYGYINKSYLIENGF